MTRFSIIIPVYNTEKYLKKCLDSVINQKFDNYEIIIVNDGSTDNSQTIINNYKNKSNKIRVFKNKNGGLSFARNFGVTKAKGDYILFLDSDDYIELDLLNILNDNIKEEIDIIRFQSHRVSGDLAQNYLPCDSFDETVGPLAFLNIYLSQSLELATLYLYNRKFWVNNKFKFAINKYHEDFGLIPLVILSSNSIKSIDYKGYYYVERHNSITTNKEYEKIRKRSFDMVYHFDYLLEESRKLKIEKGIQKIFESFISNSLISKINDLNNEDKNIYINELKKRKILKLILGDTLKRKLKKHYLKFKYNL